MMFQHFAHNICFAFCQGQFFPQVNSIDPVRKDFYRGLLDGSVSLNMVFHCHHT